MPQQPTPAIAPVEAPALAPRATTAADVQAAEQAARASSEAAVQDVAARAAKFDQGAVTAPRTAREVQGLNVRRDMLRQQLERAEDQRQELTHALQRVGDDEEGRSPDPAAVAVTRAGLEVRLKDADARVIQLERDVAATDRALTQATPEVLAQYEQQRPREPVHTGPDDGDVAGGVFGGLLAGMLLMVVGRRIRAWRRRGERSPNGAPAGVGPDPRIDRLTQAVDAIAVEVERIGEGQRFVTQLMAERRGLVPGEVERTMDVPGVR